MKISKIYILFALVILVSCSPSDAPSKELLEIEGLSYEVDSQTPYSGPFVRYFENGLLKTRAN